MDGCDFPITATAVQGIIIEGDGLASEHEKEHNSTPSASQVPLPVK
jgi:hypothetical protein